MKCECGYIFAEGYRKEQVYRDKYGKWIIICPECGARYETKN
jgi:hypothetical protein